MCFYYQIGGIFIQFVFWLVYSLTLPIVKLPYMYYCHMLDTFVEGKFCIHGASCLYLYMNYL